MSENRWDKVGKILEEARNLPPDERAAFLEERCDEEALRREVLSLLEASDEASGFFGRLESAVPSDLDDPQNLDVAEAAGESTSDPLGLKGTQVQRYEVEQAIGGGGMGVVYRARDSRLDRTVALKFLPPHLSAHDEAEERFFREARAAAALNHPHIATIHEVGEAEDGRRFIAMGYYEGETLKEKLDRRGALPIADATRFAQQVASALATAHEAEIVHRDVKPGNVVVTEGGTVKLLDFGLAKAASDTRMTEPGRQLGTAAYMSPEQARGERAGPPADVWALGVLLYEMLTGTRPFQGPQKVALLRSILHDEPVPLTKHRAGTPPALVEIVEHCLQKDPEARPPDGEAVREALKAFDAKHDRETSSPSAEPETTFVSTGGWIAAAALAILVLAGSAGWYWLSGSGGSPPPSETRLSISTQPPGAAVSIEGDRIGTTPLPDTTIEGRRVRVRATLAGYEPVDTALQLEDHQEVDLQFPLSRETTLLSVQSEPAGRVSLDKEVVGRTPLSREFKTDTVRVQVEREGYLPVDTLVALTQTEQARLRLQLNQEESEPDPQWRGTLRLRARPKGTVYLDGQRRSLGQSIRVPAGNHRVRFQYAGYAKDTTLTVEPGETQALTCYFRHRVVVQSDPVWASVYVGGENTGEDTEYIMEREPGTYEIGVRVVRGSWEVTGGEYRRSAGGQRHEEQFSGSVKTLTLTPSFEQETHVIDFQLAQDGS